MATQVEKLDHTCICYHFNVTSLAKHIVWVIIVESMYRPGICQMSPPWARAGE